MKIRKYVAVDDVGKVVNPLIVEGQVHGGLAQGIAQALYEEAVYDDDGNLTDHHDGRLPGPVGRGPARRSPPTAPRRPATTNPLGVKGVGEAGTIASTPAVVNAIVDALRPYGVQDVRMPCTPERVWRAIGRRAEAAEPGAGGGLGSAGGDHDPRDVRLRAAGARWTRPSRRCATRARTPRCSPAGRA